GRCLHVLLHEVHTVNGVRERAAGEMALQLCGGLEQHDTEPFARAIVLGNEWAFETARGLDERFVADSRQGPWGADAGALERGVLHDLAQLEPQCARGVQDPRSGTFEPGQDRCSQLWRVAMPPGVGGSAHPAVEDTCGRQLVEPYETAVEMPIAVRYPERLERAEQRCRPGSVLVNDVDVGFRPAHRFGAFVPARRRRIDREVWGGRTGR